jgi:serine/threonine protein kinase
MSEQHRPEIDEIFGAAIEIAEPEAREAYLAQVCGADAPLRHRLDKLLAAHFGAAGFMESPAPGLGTLARGADETSVIDVGPGSVVGRYRILQQLGEGGMGVVFAAEQTQPLRRTVALKVIKLGMDTRNVVARFEAERQALAMMEHPNIARVLDAGTTQSGKPYFVMELVKGVPITQYCDEHRLSPRNRVELLMQVCEAVQHAHQKGIIHRDLKPSNVLVATYDDRPVPKVIDFGVAKAVGQRLTGATLFTGLGTVVGTLEYMSPEQAEMKQLDVDTRSDVYSLGVLLYELLTGTTPLQRARLAQSALGEALRVIREEDPPKPSTRLGASEQLPSIAANRGLEPRKLAGTIRGDLDWVVMRALEKDRIRRYATANGLAMDLRRHLANEPVSAGPPSQIYRMKKFVRRNRALVGASLAVLVALVAGIIGTTTFAVRASRERAKANQLAVAERAARELADRRQKETEEVAEFQAGMLGLLDPATMAQGMLRSIRGEVRATMQRAAATDAQIQSNLERLDASLAGANLTNVAVASLDDNILKPADAALRQQFADQPLVRARILHTLANLYNGLGMFDRAIESQRESLELRRRALGDDDPLTIASMHNTAFKLQQRGRLEDAEALFREAYQRRRRVLGDDHEDTWTSMSMLGSLLRLRGKLDEAEPLLRDSLECRRKALGDDAIPTIFSREHLALLLKAQNKIPEAERLYADVLASRRRVLGNEHPDTFYAMSMTGALLVAQGKLAEAEPLLREAYDGRRRVLGDDHPNTAATLFNLAVLLKSQGKPQEAEPLFRRSMAATRRAMGPENQNTLIQINSFAEFLLEQKRYEEAAAQANESAQAALRTLGAGHFLTRGFVENAAKINEAWELADPGKGHAAAALTWRQELARLTGTDPSSAPATTSPR